MTALAFISYRNSDGVDALPDAVVLPPPFNQLADRIWRRLLVYDWKDDMARLAEARFWINSEQAQRAVVLRRER